MATAYLLRCADCTDDAPGELTSRGSGPGFQCNRWRVLVDSVLPALSALDDAVPLADTRWGIGIEVGSHDIEGGTLWGLAGWWRLHKDHNLIVRDEYGAPYPEWRNLED